MQTPVLLLAQYWWSLCRLPQRPQGATRYAALRFHRNIQDEPFIDKRS
jgi:hypothetical protein